MTVGLQDLGDNNRFRNRSNEENISILKISVSNKIKSDVTVDAIELLNETKSSVYPTLTPRVTADRMKLNTWPYLIWGILWFGSTKCENGDCESTWIPVGLVIGLANLFIARGTNSDFETEITRTQFKPTVLKEKKSANGLVFLAGKGFTFHVKLSYHVGESEKREMLVQYSI